ncbi:hypothetical protein SAMN04490244_1123 [Tranquillimonas rosea]|uniref:YncI copper-binding domain-containing protein n=1 Tax=Tranquillimonas rosea TaxID=641238 RepID=A0A1H9WND8_9RHOB|nr:DUF1775 domain-containing protein [Tranquillimonas rosea]SES35446.1 hypothetical protein SAMN04490244_1123 [Tranquillimonas rosea]
MFIKTTLTAAAALFAVSGATFAHATLEQTEAAIGATTKVTLRVPHGCDGAATSAVRIEIPEGFYSVKPMPKADWELSTETGAYETPYDNHGTEMTEGVRAVTWSGGDLPDGYYDEFTIRGTVGSQLAAGETLFFPALQTCANGTANWTDTSGSHDVPNPAPSLSLVSGDVGHGHGGPAITMGETATLGDLEIAAPFARATLPNQPVAGGFLTITNTGATDDTLVAASSPAAGRTEVHEMTMDGDVMRMRELADGLPVPAGETVTLEPGGYHVMFVDLAGPLSEGDATEVTLTFEDAGAVTLTMPVMARDATGPEHGVHSDHGSH